MPADNLAIDVPALTPATAASQIYPNLLEAILLPKLIQLDHNLIAAAFSLMKLIPAKYVVEKALREDRLAPDAAVVETSSGSYALGLAMVCALWGLKFHIYSDPAVDPFLKSRLESLGGTVHIASAGDSSNGNVQLLRLQALQAHLDAHPEAFWTRQYDNPENQEAYGIVGELLAEQIGSRFMLVAPVGSGSSSCGTVRRLRALGVDVNLVGVDTFGSVLFGLPNDRRMLRGVGNSTHPGNLAHECFDEVHWVIADDAFLYTRKLHQEKALFWGPTTGAAYQVARWLARVYPNETVVFFACDEGHRYQDTVYNDAYLHKIGIDPARTLTEEPMRGSLLQQAQPPWYCMTWGRRSFKDHTGSDY